MAVPKKRTSKSKKNQRKFHWTQKALKLCEQRISCRHQREWKETLSPISFLTGKEKKQKKEEEKQAQNRAENQAE